MGQEVSSDIHSKYVIREKKLGSGTFGQVHKGVRKADNKRVAIKVLKKKHFLKRESLKEKLQREVLIMKQCNHPYIVGFYDVFLTKSFVFICIEFCPGGDLLDYLNKRGKPIREKYAALYMGQCLEGLAYLHKKRIAHRDIKPENILLTADRKTVKLADFGLSNQFAEGDNSELFYTQCGSITHMAPEVFEGKGYDHRIDIWSLGVVLYVMLSVSYPFHHTEKKEIIRQIRTTPVDFDSDQIWNYVSVNAKDLILLMLTVDPDRRPTIPQCLTHPWISGTTKDTPVTVSASAAQFKKKGRLASSRSNAGFRREDPLTPEEMNSIGVRENDPDEEAADAALMQKGLENAPESDEEEIEGRD